MSRLVPGSRAYELFKLWILRVRPPVVKWCRQSFDPELMAWTRAQGCKNVGRWVEGDWREPGRTLDELLQFADYLDFVEFGNEEEQGKDNPREWARFCGKGLEFARDLDERNRRAGRQGPKACIANTSVGQPEIARWEMPECLDLARYMDVNGHVWGVHEYYKPVPWAMIEGDKAAWDGTPPARGWLMLRVVQAIEVMRRHGIKFRFIVTESGRDNIPGQPGEGGGFRDVPGEPFAERMGQYGRHLSAIPECVGWVDFGFNAWAGWTQFDLTLDEAMLLAVLAVLERLPGASSPGGTPPPLPEVKMLEGIDVSHHQGVMNWDQARAAGVAFALIKATEGWSYVDPQFARNAVGAARVGIPWGPYHYFLNNLDPIRQARHLAATCEGIAHQLPPCLDLEDTKTPLDEEAFARFAAEVERLMGRPVLYTGAWFLDAYVDRDISWASRLPLWLAAYSTNPAWPKAPRPWGEVAVWQYTSRAPGPAFGAQSQGIDRNRFRGNREQLLALRIPAAPAPAPDGGMDWAGLWQHAEHEQERRGVHINPESALLRTVKDDARDEERELQVVLGETTYPGPNGQARTYIVAQSWDRKRKVLLVWNDKEGRVETQERAA